MVHDYMRLTCGRAITCADYLRQTYGSAITGADYVPFKENLPKIITHEHKFQVFREFLPNN